MAKPKAETAQEATAVAPEEVRKQAVIVIHGMGEPVPMDTMRSFVDAVWEDDPLVVAEPAGEGAGVNRTAWLVPDTRTGSLELYRITTPPFRTAQGTTLSRADFYEFYWSDIMEGTTVEHLRAWLSGLLLRWPHQVPQRVRVAWVVLWFCTLLVLASALGGIGGLLPGSFMPAWRFGDVAAGVIGAVLCVVLAGFGIYLLRQRYARSLRARQASLEALWAAGLAADFPKPDPILARLLIWTVPVLLAVIFLLFAPWASILTPPALLLIFSLVIGWLTQALLVPYFGDVAHYVRAAPNTVARRAEVRERGLALLRALHAGSRAGERYDRIVVVAHSLGSIVAYDILNHFWAECGPNRKNAPGSEARAALDALDSYLQKHRGEPDFDLEEYRSLQRAVSRALAKEECGWRISDLITLGSPLSHAAFLLAKDDVDLANRIEERQLPICPPGPADDSRSFFVPIDGTPRDKWLPHHATLFTATRWTNIYDPHPWRGMIFHGDLISGRVGNHPDYHLKGTEPGRFGEGIRDIAVEMRRPCPVLGDRCFTHTLYWSLLAHGKRLDGDNTEGYGQKAHVEVLREAIGLADPA
jgi:hypothetical protein